MSMRKSKFIQNLLRHGAVIVALSAPWAQLQAQHNADVLMLQRQWDHIMFEVDKKQQEAAFARLVELADSVTSKQPDSAELLIWSGIVHSTYAGAKGGLGALSEVRKARTLFEKALRIDDSALHGAAYTSLGSLYYQVPGWPVGFGDDDKADELLKKALTIDAAGLDANYFYGDFLLHEKQYARAIEYLERAAAAPPRAGREIADAGRRRQIREAVMRAQSHLEK